MALIERLLSGRITKGTLTIHRPDGSASTLGTSTPNWPDIHLRIIASNAERRILTNPSLGLGECYMDGSVSVDHDDIMGLVALVRGNNPWESGGKLKPESPLKQAVSMALRPLRQLNNLANSRSNVAHHYDLSNDFYRQWLDSDMQYSCAYWPDGVDTLEQAQIAKKAHIAAKLHLRARQRVLDIGCGWGGMALYLNRVADVDVLGITLSSEQLKLAQERAEKSGVSDRVKFELIDYRDLAIREPQGFDRIVSVGMFEHVGVPQFDAFFRAVTNLMTDDGVMLLHTIGRMGSPSTTDAFTRKYIFPGGYIPALSETLAASEKVKLIHSDVENLRIHYAKTLREWYQRVQTIRAAVISQYDEKFYRMWLFYLAGATAAFESGGMCNYQIQYIRSRHNLPLTRDYMAEVEKEYLAKG
ncbi:class I SAM-dependent methyltransferase [Sphingorhabdus arenilitoris]|uniref:Class I SAM-dependent methyltransferase n=1 Tax=Sphingorhabdus arenilitoris TaxID=1490041 RepID=A0ABV8RIW4_9SPHN